MDITRGPRRARHLAAAMEAAAAANTAPNATGLDEEGSDVDALHPPEDAVDRHATAPRGQLVTPNVSQRTPDQQLQPMNGGADHGSSAARINNPLSSGGPTAPLIHPFRLHRAMPQARLSMPDISDDSDGSEPDLSILAMTRPGGAAFDQSLHLPPYDISQEHLQDEETSLEEEEEEVEDLEGEEHHDEELEEGDPEGDEEHEEYVPLVDPATLGLKEISNLGKFTVSSHKQGNSVEELRNDDLNQYWQSDGPQPHKLTVYFVKRVGIRDLRFYVNYNEDESYTPTKIIFKSGTSENNLIEFAQMTLETPVGWQQVSLNGAGGGPDGNTLVSYVLQMQILENHQNGKDTHLRGIKIYAFDMDSGQAQGRENNPVADMVEFLDSGSAAAAAATAPSGEQEEGGTQRLSGLARRLADTRIESGEAGLTIPDFMRDPEIR